MKRALVYGGLALAVVVGAYCFGRRDRAVTEQERQWAKDSEAALKQSRAFHGYIVATQRQVQRAQVAAQQARAVTNRAIAAQDRLGREIEALKGNTEEMTTTADSLRHFQALYQKRTQQQMQTAAALTSMTLERDLASEQVGSLTAGLGAAKSRVSELEGLLKRGVELQKCRILGLVDCPSRTASFFGGTLVGLGIALAT